MIKLIPFERYRDDRGHLSSVYKKNDILFVEDRLSYSKKGVLRGLHGDMYTGKLFIPINGVFQFYAKSLFTDDKIFCSSFSEEFETAIYVPPGYINGHLCLTDNCIMLYKWTYPYTGPENQFTVRYDDKDLNINWDYSIIFNISDRDKNGITFKELKEKI